MRVLSVWPGNKAATSMQIDNRKFFIVLCVEKVSKLGLKRSIFVIKVHVIIFGGW